jgi:ABC-type multidrug transport system fused ATPase/permease subunit
MSFFNALDTEGYDRQYTDRQLIRRMLQYFGPHKRRLAVVVVLILVIALAGAATPVIVSRGVDLLAEVMSLGYNFTACCGGFCGRCNHLGSQLVETPMDCQRARGYCNDIARRRIPISSRARFILLRSIFLRAHSLQDHIGQQRFWPGCYPP